MTGPLLATKLSPPQIRRNLVARPRLVHHLGQAQPGTLILVSAPAGYGKTTLISDWLYHLDCPSSWLSLDEGDNDPVRFLGYFVTALQKIDPVMGSTVMGLQQAMPPPPMEVLMAVLVNEIVTFQKSFVFVLDDYHLIEASAVHQLLSFVFDHFPSNLLLVILTRSDPPLPIPRLLARNQCLELRASHVRFTLEETAYFLEHVMGLELNPQDVSILESRTEGWVAGLQMAGLSLQSRDDRQQFLDAFRGDDRYIMDYLMDEVFRLQLPSTQEFLLCTSILDRLSAPLCAAVLSPGFDAFQDIKSTNNRHIHLAIKEMYDPAAGQEMLEQLEKANLFLLSLDQKREWYRYHHLFADLLRYRLERERPGLLPELHRRASWWYVRVADPDSAIKHALETSDLEFVAQVAEQFALLMTGSGRLVAYLSWLQRLPDEFIFQRAYLCAGCAWAYVLTFQLEPCLRYVAAGESALAHFEKFFSLPDGRWITREEVSGNLAAIHSYAYRFMGRLDDAVQYAHQALNTLPTAALSVRCAVSLNLGLLYMDARQMNQARQALAEAFDAAQKSQGNVYVAVSALSISGGIAYMQGKLGEAEKFFIQAVEYRPPGLPSIANIPAGAVIHGWFVALHYQRNQISMAQQHLDLLLPAAVQAGVPETLIRTWLYQALLFLCRGELVSADAWLHKAEELMKIHPVRGLIHTEWLTIRGSCYLVHENLTELSALLESQGIDEADLDEVSPSDVEQLRSLGERLGSYLLKARFLLLQGALTTAEQVLDKVAILADAYPDFPTYLQALVLKVILADRKADRSKGVTGSEQAQAFLQHALNLAAPEGFIQPFLIAAEPKANLSLISLLRQAIILNIQSGFARVLLDALAEKQRNCSVQVQVGSYFQKPASAQAEMLEPLTGREQQILRLLAAGLSSTEVAEHLVVSVNTSRSYIKSLYRKLDAHSREEAIETGHRLGLL